ncbi:MAG: tRNA pseudouridine(55) synthase TruB [Nitrospiria bacterium]
MVEGVLNIDKPAGWTSHDVVARLRKILKIKKIGHAGTLDPDATGVLVVCVGKATKIVEYLVGTDKEYEAVMRLGETTNTQDASGNVLEKASWGHLTEEDLFECFKEFTGEISQTPSSYSAIKVGGVPSYKLARRGEEVDIPERKVKIYKIEFIKKAGPDVFIKVHCSKGTYIRTLCHDMGRHMGVGAHLFALRRTRSGIFMVGDALSLDDLIHFVETGRLDMEIYGMDEVMSGFPAIVLDEDGEKKIVHGNPVFLSAEQGGAFLSGSLVRLKSINGGLIALGVLEGEELKKVKIEKVLIH